MSLETFEAGYAGARPPRTGSQWSGMWKLAQITDRAIDDKWPNPWSLAGGTLNKSFAIIPGDGTPQAIQFSDDGTKFYIVGQTNDTIYQYSCSTAWDIRTASYSSKSFIVTTQETLPNGLFFKPDGTKFYIVGATNDTVYQYSCSTAWDISTASYDSKSFSATQEPLPTGLFFKPDGTKFYIVGSNADTVHQYSCSTAWDVSTASYDSKSFSVNSQESSAQELFFKSDGTKFYIIGITNRTVYQYSCSTAWDISTASYDSKSFSVNAQESGPTGLFFKPDGTEFYIVGTTNDNVFQYSCSTAWDVSTGSYANKATYVGTQVETNSTDGFFKPDGTKFYIVGNVTDTVYQYSCSTAWDVSTASYDSKSFSVTAQEGLPNGLFFKPDGTKFYIVGNANDTVYQYSCSTAWDVSTASYDSKSFSVTAQETTPNGLFFKDDGTKFYIVGQTNDTVYQYSCSTAWDVSTASYDSKSFSVAAQETTLNALFFKDDGTKFYIVGSANDTVYQYSCSTAWDVSTASYDTKSFSVAAQESSPTGLFFKSDGTKFYIVGSTNNTVYQYSCGTAWDISTTSVYDSKSFSVATQENTPNEVFFKPDGTKFYILGTTNDTVYQYSCSTAWDVSTASYDSKSFSVATQETVPTGLFFKDDGTKFYIIGTTNDTVYQYACSTAWDVSTASYDSKSFSVAGQETGPTGLFFKSDGTKFYILGSQTDRIYQYSCSTAWDISTASYDSKSFSTAAQETTPNGLFFKSDGAKFYIVGSVTDTVYQYSCSTAWDVSTASYDSKLFSVAAQEATPTGLFFKSDGTKFYIVGTNSDTVYQYSSAGAWIVQSAVYDNKLFIINGQESNANGLFFKPDGTKFYIVGSANDTVYQYSCSTAWDVSTASYDSKSFSVAAQETTPTGLFFKDDGTKFYILGTGNDAVFQYSCSTAWDVSTASYDSKSFSVAAQEANPQGLFFKSDGTKFYIVGSLSDTVYQYSCSTAWDVSTAFYDTKSFSVAAQDNAPTGLFFKDDGTKFYIVGTTNDTVYQYSCSTAWDVSTASYDAISYSVTTLDTSPLDIHFKSDGTQFYVLGENTDTIYQHSCLLQ